MEQRIAAVVLFAGCSPAPAAATPPSAPPPVDPADGASISAADDRKAEPTLPVAPAVSATDPNGLTPPPVDDVGLAGLPVDVRVAEVSALLTTHRKDCKAFARRSPCELRLDLDGDGTEDAAFKIRDRSSGHAGIAVRWSHGGVSIIGAGVRTRQLATDVHMDGTDLSWREVEADFADNETESSWGIAVRVGGGFRRGGAGSARGEHVAPGITGDGLWLDGGDAAEILYWDGERWRRLVLGY